MANETLSTSIDELSAIAVAEARETMTNSVDLRNYVSRFTVPEGAISIRVPKMGSLTASALTEGNSAANQEFTSTGVVLTPSTNAVAQISMTDLASHNAPQAAVQAGRAFGRAIIAKINADIAALFDGFSTALGTTNVDITEALIRGSVRRLMEANAPGPYYMAMPPRVFEDLMAIYSTNTNQTSDRLRDAIMAGEQPTIYGVIPVVSSSGFAEDGNDDYKIAVFSQEALGYAESWDIRIEPQRDASLVGQKWVASAAYAVGELDDTYGVELLVDGA